MKLRKTSARSNQQERRTVSSEGNREELLESCGSDSGGDSSEDDLTFEVEEPFSPASAPPDGSDEEISFRTYALGDFDSDEEIKGRRSEETSQKKTRKKQTKSKSAKNLKPKKKLPARSKKSTEYSEPMSDITLESVIEQDKIRSVKVVLEKLPDVFVREYLKYLHAIPNTDEDDPTSRKRMRLKAGAFSEMQTSIKCVICQKAFKNHKQLATHMKKHEGNEGFTCVCGAVWKTFRSFYFHTVNTHSRQYQCPYCDLKFPGAKLWKKHSQETHSKSFAFLCTLCGKGFRKPFKLLEHFNHHTGLQPHKCQHCGKAYRCGDALVDHSKQHFREYKCNICDKVYSSARMLRSHSVTHVSERKFTCNICGKAFKYQSNLGNHRQSHEEKKFSCDTCGQMFRRRYDLTKHYTSKKHEPCSHSPGTGRNGVEENITSVSKVSLSPQKRKKSNVLSVKASNVDCDRRFTSRVKTSTSPTKVIRSKIIEPEFVDSGDYSRIEINQEPLFLDTRISAVMDVVENDSDDETLSESKELLSL